jgi:hypothetical protein
MKVWISDSLNRTTTVLKIESCNDLPNSKFVCLEGELPEGIALQDLSGLGTVSYTAGNRGRPIPKICRVEPSENLDYVQALIEAMPPGYYVSRVESDKIDQLREEKARLFFQEIEHMSDLSGRGDSK